ncbi:MAG: RNase adapter RapZ [Endomicrobiales bacterium]|nr:RNase adapter RapZ [Endomicrobiales bacterium]
MSRQFLIVTGISGAGRSLALKNLEDMGYFAVDNIPVSLVSKFADLCVESGGKLNKVAVGLDIRAGKESLDSIEKIVDDLKKRGIRHRILFFTADDATLFRRYAETRRRHPLARRISEGINAERKMMLKILYLADDVIDTSHLTGGELKEILTKKLSDQTLEKMKISVLSFGFKYGLPLDADLVFDVRFLPNPNYVASLRYKTGKDVGVKNYVFKHKEAKDFIVILEKMLSFLIPNFIKEGKSHLTIALGCTGGHHRSVAVSEKIGFILRKKGYMSQVYHRDIHN